MAVHRRCDPVPGRHYCCHLASLLTVVLLGGAVVSSAAAASDKTIQIDEDLRANAEVLKVRLGTSTPAHQVNIEFGEYSVVSSKAWGGRETTTTSGFLSPVQHTRVRNHFKFVLKGASSTTAKVNAEWNILSEKSGHCFEIDFGDDVTVEYCSSDEEVQPGFHDLIVASIQIDGEAASRWTLLLDVVRSESGLTERAGTSADPAKGLLDLPARGFEFSEAGQSIAAVQYYAGGVLGLNKNVVYLRRDLDPQTKLLLASAMTAIMEYKLGALLED